MSRKRSFRPSPLLEFVSALPWWLGLTLAVVSGVWLHSLATAPVTVDMRHMEVTLISGVVRGGAYFAQFCVPMLLVLGAVASFFRQRKRRQQRDANTVPDAETQVSQSQVAVPAPEVVAQPVTTQVPKARPKVKAQPAPPLTPAAPAAPACPHCKQTMVMKVARTGANAGGNFWGCSGYPKCRGIRAIFAPLPSKRV